MKQLHFFLFAFLFNVSMAHGQALGFIGTDTTTLTNSPTLSRLAFKDDNLYRIRNTRPAVLIAASEYNLTNLVGVTGKIKVTNGTGAVQGTVPVVLTFSDTLVAEARLETPLLVGGTGASRVLTVQSTLSAGTSDAISFKTGSQVERMRIGTSGAIRFNSYTAGIAKFDGSGNITSGTISSGDIPSLSATYLSLAIGGTVNAGVVATSFKSPTAIIENRKNGSEMDRYTWRLVNNGANQGQSLVLDYYQENTPVNFNSPNMLYMKNGLIGIFNTNPTYTLDLSGSFRASNARIANLTGGGSGGLVRSDSVGNLTNIIAGNDVFVRGDGSLDPTVYLSTSAAGVLYAPLNNPTFTGTVTIPTLAVSGVATLKGNKVLGNGTGDISSNNIFGINAFQNNTTGNQNVGIGTNSLLANTTGSSNIAIGHNSQNANTTGIGNTSLGSSALVSGSTASYNTAIGNNAMNSGNSGYSTALGRNALGANSGGYSIGIGYDAGSQASGTGNVFIGSWDGTGVSTNNGMYFSTGDNTRRMTILNSGNLGVGTTSPTEKLHVSGNIKVDTAKLVSGSISGTLGVAGVTTLKDTYINNSTIFPNFNYGIDWGTNTEGGNTNITTSSTGDLRFFVNSGIDGFMSLKASNGFVGIGTTTPAGKLDVASTTSAFYPPRMSASEKAALTGLTAGAVIYCTDCVANDTSGGVLQIYNGSVWKSAY